MRKAPREALGTIKRHPDGFGFFISDNTDDPDVYIPRNCMDGIMSNDRVKVAILKEPGGDRFRGEVLEVVKRSTARVLGQFRATGTGKGILLDKSFAWGEDLKVSVPPGMEIKDGDWVAVHIEEYPESVRGFSGKVITVIGDAQDPRNDSKRMLHQHNIPFEFSKAAIAEADALPLVVTPKDIDGRRDLRKLPIITIDGKTAKDFDDAVFSEVTDKGFHLIVAIADVSHYVKPGSKIDDDAYERGTSTYFPNFVAPMLPEKLSNELCSLKPNVDRLALVADMQLDFQGQLIKSEFFEGVIKSQARVTYGEAQEVIENVPMPQFDHVKENILRCADLAKVLMAKRFREGSLDLEIPETEIEIDETGQPVDIMQTSRLFAHRLIEELMLMANVAVARFFKQKSIAGIYRIHEEPAADAMVNFTNFLKAFGYNEKVNTGHLQKKMTKALEFFKGHPKVHILNVLALRSLMQAKYSPNNVGHFGLGFADYTHFTSPIRRYPDLIVHRLVKALIVPEKGYGLIPLADLETAGTMLSACEQRSVKAERQIHSIKKARFMSKHIGEEFDGVINSVARFGCFVLLRQFDIDGLIRVEELGGDRFEFDEEKLKLVGKKSGMTYEIGEPLKIKVARADVEQGQIDFVLAGEGFPKAKPSGPQRHERGQRQEQSRNVQGPRKAQSSQKRSPSQDDRGGLRSKRLSKPRRPR